MWKKILALVVKGVMSTSFINLLRTGTEEVRGRSKEVVSERDVSLS